MCTFAPKNKKTYMRSIIITLLAACCLTAFVACNDYETYGDKKEKERKAIKSFIADSSIVVITEAQFHAQGDMTDVSKNEFVYLNNSSVYMQIERKGCGTPIQDGESTTLLVRFVEVNIMNMTYINNDTSPYDPDYLTVSRSGSTYSGAFTKGTWYSTYASSYSGSATAPNGLLVPFSYINVGRPRSATDQIAKVRLIVPHSQGHAIATSGVYPYYYELTFERQIDL